MKVVAIIQSRMGATRLPGKVLEDLAGQPMLARVVHRTRLAKTLNTMVVATTTQAADDVIVNLCETQGWPFFRGSEDDVLDRYYNTASAFNADAVVRITSDCPLIEPEIIDRIIGEFFTYHPKIDYVSNSLQRTFPQGLDVEVISFDALKKAWQEDHNPKWREHVTPYITRHPELFRIHNVTSDVDYSFMRWTVDTMDDLTFVRKIYEHFQDDTFNWKEVLQLLENHPEWLEINRHIQQKATP